MNGAPIALFCYDRPVHLKETIEALKKNSIAIETDLYFFCDGPKAGANSEQINQIQSVQGIANSTTGFRSVKCIFSEMNRGLAQSIVTGVTAVLSKSDRVIVLEDDILVAPCFLDYMNTYLNLYADEKKVASIHAYSPPIDNLPDLYFLRGTDCWGWATWKDRWDQINLDPVSLLKQLKDAGLCQQFDLDGGYPYTKMLEERISGQNNSWAILWHASMFLQNRLTLNPGKTLAENIGRDGSGTHSRNEVKKTRSEVLSTNEFPKNTPAIHEDLKARAKIGRFLGRKDRLRPIKDLIRKFIPR